MEGRKSPKLTGAVAFLDLKRRNLFLAIVGIAALFVTIGLLHAFAGYYAERIVIGLGINMILVVSLNLANGYTGLFSLGHVGFMAIGAYASSILTLPIALKETNLPDLPGFLSHVQLPFLPAALIAALVAMAIAFLIGLSLMRLTGPYISVATMGFLVIVQVVLTNWDSLTRGARTFAGVPGYTSVWNVWIWAVVTMYVVWRIGRSSFGRKMMAVRDNEIAARSLGIHVLGSRLLAFCVSAFFTGIAGALWAHFITAFSPKSFYFTQTFSVVTMLVVGGLGSVSGSVLGVVLITLLSELLRNAERGFSLGSLVIPATYGSSQVIMAILFVLFIVFRPKGLTGGVELDFGKLLGKKREVDV
jgi:branched-chain amino acid transport system permease protein